MIDNAIFNAEFYQKLNRLRLPLQLHAAAGMNGTRKSRAKGSSVEFSDFRDYIPGDDIRRIDWNAYGRFDKLFVKLFMEEKEGIFQIFLDGSASMSFGNKSKEICAKRLAAALSYAILENSDRVCLNIISNDKLSEYKGVTGKQALSKVIDNLSRAEFSGESELFTALQKKLFVGRGVSVLISDLFTDRIEEILKYLTLKKQEIILIQVLAREEAEPMLEGTVRLLDSENASDLKVTMSASLIKEYKKRYEHFIKRIDSLCRRYSARYIRVMSDESIDSILFGQLMQLGR